jgi:D-lyxose ketol-isomerase
VISRAQYDAVRQESFALLAKSGVSLTQAEMDAMEVADFGLGRLHECGAQIITLVETDLIAAKLIVLLPHQVLPEHQHPQIGEYAGKEETIRSEWGELYVYGPGGATPDPKGPPPVNKLETFTVWHEHVLSPGDQVTFPPNTPHWFQGGPLGAVCWSFSTKVVDMEDVFRDPDVIRVTLIGEV